MNIIQIQSIQSLYLETQFNGQKLSSATGFVTKTARGLPILITNRHVVTGRHQDTNKVLSKKGAIPNEIVIFHNQKDNLGSWVKRVEPLLNRNEEELWHEHPTLAKKVDFVALKLSDISDVDFHTHNLGVDDPKIATQVTDKISVVGFPFGIRNAGGFAIWATGSIASEPVIDHDGLPMFLIDCRSREGQSGSPVLAYRSGSETIWLENNSMIANSQPMSRFLGIYSGRVNPESDLGKVWKSSSLIELVESI